MYCAAWVRGKKLESIERRMRTVRLEMPYLRVQVQGSRKMLDRMGFIMQHFIELAKEVMHIGLIRSHVLEDLQFC